MSELGDLYQEMILDHSKRPRNRRELAPCDGRADGHNPLCGDKVSVMVRLDGDRLADVAFTGSGCAISTASASLMTEAVKGKSAAETGAIFDRFHDLVTGKADPDAAALGKLAVFSGVSEFPMRVKCATLAWHTLQAALRHDAGTVNTEKDSPP